MPKKITLKKQNFRTQNGTKFKVDSFKNETFWVIFKQCGRQTETIWQCLFLYVTHFSESKMLLFLQLTRLFWWFLARKFKVNMELLKLHFLTFFRHKDFVHNEWLFPDLKTFLRGVEKNLSKELKIRWGNCEEELLEIEGSKK